MIKFLDLTDELLTIKDEVNEAIQRVLLSGRYILGPEVEAFEHEVAKYLGVRHAVGVSSGTDALIVSLLSLGIGPGDEVITSPYTFVATAEAIARVGAKPVFVDVGDDYNIDPRCIEKAITRNTVAIIPVHSFGRKCWYHDSPWPEEFDCLEIEDACQSIGASKNIGDIQCYSFFPSKNLGCYGDGGLVTTDSGWVYQRLVSLRSHGRTPEDKYLHSFIGGNFRLDEIQAAILGVKLKHLDQWINERADNAETYRIELADAPVICPEHVEGHVYNQFVIQVDKRDDVRQKMKELGVETEVYYPCPLHLQECFKYLGYKKGDFPVAERLASRALALPIYPGVWKHQGEIVSALRKALSSLGVDSLG